MKKFLHIGILALALAAPLAHAQSEPSMSEIYAAAQAGQMDKAHAMVQQVLVTHPNSAKAHYVQAELYAKEGRYALARDNLAEAERIAPGLPFAKPQAVNALKAELAATPARAANGVVAAPVAPAQDNSHWVWLVLLAGGVMVLGYFIFRDRRPAAGPVAYPDAGGAGTMGGAPYGGSPYGGAPYGGGYGYGNPPPAPGIGSRIAGGVATGLAVGAGVVPAEAIGERLFGHEDRRPGNAGYTDGGNYVPVDTNSDMGGNDFGVNDTSWDGGGGSSGSDWDN